MNPVQSFLLVIQWGFGYICKIVSIYHFQFVAELTDNGNEETVKGTTDDDIIRKCLSLLGPFIEMRALVRKSSKRNRGILSETFDRCIDKMVMLGMGTRHEATPFRKNGHPLLLQVWMI